MNRKKISHKLISLICLLSLLITGPASTLVFADTEETEYFVCFSDQNYAVRNANKMTSADEGYILKNVSLSSLIDFYITDNRGTRWYASDNRPLSVDESQSYAYDILFSPDIVYSEEKDGFAATDCHITYRFYEPAKYSLQINGKETALSYNPYFTSYDLYFISSIELEANTVVSYKSEKHTVSEGGFYRILFTPESRVNNSTYLFDENGNYGSGDRYIYHIYIEDAPQYFAVFEDQIDDEPDAVINGENAYALSRYENNVALPEYRSSAFFVGERDKNVRYTVYELSANGSFALIDDDNNKDTSVSRLTASDIGWYTLSLTVSGNIYLASLADKESSFGGWYAVGSFNGYGFDGKGDIDISDRYRFIKVEDGDDDYNEDYEQYLLYLTVTDKEIREGDFEFFITDGKRKYKDNGQYISISTAGSYKILFSEEHSYGRGRRFQYILEDENKDAVEITIGSVEEFLSFAEKCTFSADYSVDLRVYLTADLDFTGVSFRPIGNFSGSFFGGYHKLSNITYTGSGKSASVFSSVSHSAVIERLTVENIDLGDRYSDYVGFIGTNYGTVRHITVSGKINGNMYVGGIAAYNGRSNTETGNSADLINNALIEHCESYVSISGQTSVGGICGQNMGEVISCTSGAEVSGRKNRSSSEVENIGGISGYSIGKIYDCTNKGNVTGGESSQYVGGIVGRCSGEVYFSYNHGSISADSYAGGIVGYYGIRQENSDGLGTVPGLPGLGQNGSSEQVSSINIINYTANYGNITAHSYVGGIVGAVGNIGNSDNNLLRIYNSASVGSIDVTAGSYAGGIAGYGRNVDISDCVTSGSIQAKGTNGGNYVGGIVGYGGDVRYSMSSATIKGNDYVGGIAGFATSSLSGCYTNILLLYSEGSENIGSIAGDAAMFDQMTQEFTGIFGNYYIGSEGGIKGVDYAAKFDHAAERIDPDILSSDGVLSPVLCEEFSREHWQGGGGSLFYPTLRNFERAEECEEFDDDILWSKLFEDALDTFRSLTEDAARLTYSVIFMEWNKDNGDLYDDDGVLQTDNFDIIATLRGFDGENVEIPALIYAALNEKGLYVYEGSDARYFVNFPETVKVNGNMIVYANYSEILTSLTDESGTVLIEGEFFAGTKVRLISIGDHYTLNFTLNGEEISVDAVTVKFLVDDNGEKYSVYLSDGSLLDSEVSGKYISFTFSSGDYFRVCKDADKELPLQIWLLIGFGAAATVCAITAICVIGIYRKKITKLKNS